MAKEQIKIIWSEAALKDLEDIYDFYQPLSKQGAENVIADILNGIETITQPEIFRRDEINPKYRRVVVRHYKVLYTAVKTEVFIARIFDARQDPSKML